MGCAQVQALGWLSTSSSSSRAGPAPSCPHSGVSHESRGQGREPFIFPLEIKQEAERVWFSLIFFFKSFLASLPHLLPIFLRGGGQRGAGNVWQLFVFNLHKPILCVCVCVFFLFSGNSLQTGTSCRNHNLQGKKYLTNMFVFFPFWFALGLQNPGAGLCAADPVEHQPPVTASTVLPHQPCLSHSLLQPCKASSWAALQLLWVCQSPGRQLQVVGWTFGVLPKPGVTLVELHQCVLSRWGSDVLPWQKATPDVLPAVHIWFSLHSGGWGGSDGYS